MILQQSLTFLQVVVSRINGAASDRKSSNFGMDFFATQNSLRVIKKTNIRKSIISMLICNVLILIKYKASEILKEKFHWLFQL